MKRRHLLLGGAAAFGAGSLGLAWWLQGRPSPIAGLADLAAARRWLTALRADAQARTSAGWPLAQVLEHAAQSVEYSIDGYPQANPALFQRSIGALAFAAFTRQGAMRHSLTEAIPGAPALVATDIAAAADRLLAALDRFAAHQGKLAPHFAYGTLAKAEYERAHLMHLVDHARWISPAIDA